MFIYSSYKPYIYYEGELENEPFFICGWITTEEGRKTEIWKQEEIKEEKINIIFNKANKYKINERVLNEIYSEKRIIGEIDYSEKYNLIINKNIFKDKDDYEKIFQKVIEGV